MKYALIPVLNDVAQYFEDNDMTECTEKDMVNETEELKLLHRIYLANR